jgi:methylglutamate dehydrogenase subunit D
VVNSALNAPLLRSPMQGHTTGSRPNVVGYTEVELSGHMCNSVTLISTWIGGSNALEAALGSAIGAEVTKSIGGTQQTPRGLLMRSGPHEFLLVGSEFEPGLVPALRERVSAEIGSVVDLSHARCRIRVEGAQSRAVLNKLFALDLNELEFPVGEILLTGHHHVPSVLHRLGLDSFDLYVLSTYAHDQLAALLDAAQEYGLVLHSV